MNKTVNFGYHSFTLGYFVKLNVKLRTEDAKLLETRFSGLATIYNSKYGYRVEGVVVNSEMPRFHKDLEMMKLDYKIEVMMNKKADMLSVNLPQIDLGNVNFDEI